MCCIKQTSSYVVEINGLHSSKNIFLSPWCYILSSMPFVMLRCSVGFDSHSP